MTGTGSQTGGLTRWGDYSAMTIDPVDDCTFWFTQEYMKANGAFNWNTRIAHFKFLSCPTQLGVASYSATLLVPSCSQFYRACDSGPSLVLGKDNMTGGAETNQPNTIHNSCADGTSGTFHVNESIDRLKVASTNGLSMIQGSIVRVTATVWVADPAQDVLDLYYATNANSPSWVFIGTLVPQAAGAQNLTTLFRLRPGALQAIRANFRKGGAKSSCSAGQYDDHDDLAFAVRSWSP